MLRVYVAGKYTPRTPSAIEVFENMREGMRMATVIMLKGFAPFTPWTDYHYILMTRGSEKISLEQYYEYSKAWLEMSDILYVLPDYQDSKGTLAEIQLAREIGIPIVYSLEELLKVGDALDGKPPESET